MQPIDNFILFIRHSGMQRILYFFLAILLTSLLTAQPTQAQEEFTCGDSVAYDGISYPTV